MPRIRNLKPDFFTDADLLELSPLHRLLFEGLWCWADREGRLEDKPKELKLRILPADAADVGAMLSDLERAGKIIRYAVGTQRLIAVKNFTKHQRCHKDEKASELPAPPPVAPKRAESFEAGISLLRAGNPPVGAGKIPVKTPETETETGAGDGDGRRKPEPAPASLPPLGRPNFRDQVDAAFLEARGAPYSWSRADEDAVRELLGKGGQDEILRRWRIGLGFSFPLCTGVVSLLRNWNAYAKAEPTGPPPRDVTRGIARVDSTPNRVVDEDGTIDL